MEMVQSGERMIEMVARCVVTNHQIHHSDMDAGAMAELSYELAADSTTAEGEKRWFETTRGRGESFDRSEIVGRGGRNEGKNFDGEEDLDSPHTRGILLDN